MFHWLNLHPSTHAKAEVVQTFPNRMSQITLNIAGSTQTYDLTYDAVGNLTSKQNTAG